MSTITKPRTNVFVAIGSLFSSGIDVNNEEIEELPVELKDAWKALESKEKDAEQAINVANNTSKKGGFGKKINPIKDANTEKAMREKYNQAVRESSENGREIGE